MQIQDLAHLESFQGVPEAELEWLLANSREETLAPGDYFFQENGPAGRFYIVLEGELQVSRTLDGREMILGTTPAGIMGGEGSLLLGTPSDVTARAIAPSRLLVLDAPAFRALFSAAPTLGANIFRTAIERTQGFASTLKQREKMAALGKLSAGLAHELNNPSAAACRAASALAEALPDLQKETFRLAGLGLSSSQVENLVAFQRDTIQNESGGVPLAPLEQSDREEVLGAWLGQQGVEGASNLAAALVTAGATLDDLQALASFVPGESARVLYAWLSRALNAANLAREVEQNTNRISELVGAIKEYTYMDQGAVQEVDIHRGLENTLRMLRYRLKDITPVREYAPDLPLIQGRGGDLNQVWTNLIDNAIDATGGQGTLWIITRRENDFVMVEIADDGPGIPESVLPRLFEPFFTTKGVGEGSGLGLDISYRIIQSHSGAIEVRSEPGRTRFIVRLPIHQA